MGVRYNRASIGALSSARLPLLRLAGKLHAEGAPWVARAGGNCHGATVALLHTRVSLPGVPAREARQLCRGGWGGRGAAWI